MDRFLNVVSMFLSSLGEAPGPAPLWPSGGGSAWAGVRPGGSGSVRGSGRTCPTENPT